MPAQPVGDSDKHRIHQRKGEGRWRSRDGRARGPRTDDHAVLVVVAQQTIVGNDRHLREPFRHGSSLPCRRAIRRQAAGVGLSSLRALILLRSDLTAARTRCRLRRARY